MGRKEKIKLAIWIMNRLIDKNPDYYKVLKDLYLKEVKNGRGL
jgi:hypothetical protein